MSDIWGDKSKENSENKRPGIPALQTRQGAPVLPPPSIPSAHSTMESGGYYTLPAIGRLGNSSLKFALNPIGNHINGPPGYSEGQPMLNQQQQQQQHQQQHQQHQQIQQQQLQQVPQVLQGQGQPVQSNQQQVPNPSQLPPQIAGQSKAKDPPRNSGGSNMSFYRPLNVKDALTYLDQVKHQFQTRPDVYNHFLDIMKDFKSQSIDTPGVIERVSSLFRGHPSLIQGFNTFLPPGYRIECSIDPSDPNSIRVTTPLGTTTTIAESKPKPANGNDQFNNWRLHPNPSPFAPSNPQVTPDHLRQQDTSRKFFEQNQEQKPGSFVNNIVPGSQHDGYQNASGAAGDPQQPQHQSSISDLQAAANRGGLIGSINDRKQGGPIEFSNAINYVNKIKTRFANQPDIYKHFLEILQTYQREQKPIAEVYSQVTLLFQHAPDLLDDFKQFLPDTTDSSSSGLLATQQTQSAEYYQPGQPQLPPVGNFSAPSSNVAPGVKGKSDEMYDPTKVNKDIQISNLRGSVSGTRRKTIEETTPTLVPGVPEPLEPIVKTSSLSEEIGFFDKVKKAIGSKQTYNEFLKILNLFTQDIIDKDVLVERVEGFIGSHPDLFEWFKSFVGFEDKPYHIENITFKKHQLDSLLCKPYGPSYRKLPKVETYMPCSGRDDMCWEILNDEWVGHPTWASEDSGFIAHRKNQYEEILFRIEEERHEYDFYMESNLRTIQTLETIANRIANMTPEEKATFRLPNGLGHTSQTIYKKVVRKIYGKEKGFEVIDALHDNPAIAVPIVLRRLKQKDEEWRRAHREWNKVWREMEQKVFFKSLDHLGLTFKQADKKLLTSKQLISEISTIKSEQTNKRLHPLTPKPKEQLEYDFHDNDILYDIIKLVFVFLSSTSSYSSNDKERLFDFLKSFVSLFFDIDSKEVDEAVSKRLDLNKEEKNQEKGATNGTVSTSSSSTALASENDNTRKRHREPDLLKDVLKKSRTNKSTRDETPESSTSPGQDSVQSLDGVLEKANEDDAEAEEEDLSPLIDSWVKIGGTEGHIADPINYDRNQFNLFGNTNIYIFFRHLRVLYDRLLEVKNLNEEVTNDIKGRSDVEFAKDLNLISNQLADMGLEFTKDDAYTQLLTLSERVIAGDVEHQWFEESLRQAYRNRAYKLYTVDKVTQALVKHLHSIIADSRSSEIIVLFEKDRKAASTTAKDQIIYRYSVRSQMNPDENMFRIGYDEPRRHVTIEYIALDDLTLKNHKTEEEKWSYYLTSYIISHPTEGVNTNEVRMPFTKSYDPEEADESEYEGFGDPHLQIKIAPDTYKLSFQPETYDEFTRLSVYNNVPKVKPKNLDSLKKKVDNKLQSTTSQEDDEESDAALKFGDEIYDVLINDPSKYKSLLEKKENEEKSKSLEDDQDKTIEKADETLPDAPITIKKVNPVLYSALEQDVTVDNDSTLPQDDTELKGNDTTTEENGDQDETTNVVDALEKGKSTLDKDGDVKMV